MTDDFESELRDALAGAVPTPPEEPGRAAGARRYSRRVRRTRAVLAVGVAAAVVAAIMVVPSVLASSSDTAGPGGKTPQVRTPLVMPPLEHPFTCASESWPGSAPQAGVVPPGAVLARICPVGLRAGYWSAPAEPLVTGVSDLIDELNSLPKTDLGTCPGFFQQHSYTVTFQYPDGRVVSAYGVLDGCPYISVGQSTRSGAETLLRGYLDRLHAQRTHFSPPESVPSAPACLSARRVDSLGTYIVDHRLGDLVAARACSYEYPAESNPTAEGALSTQQVEQLSADLAAHATRQEARSPTGNSCDRLRGPRGALLIEGTNNWGDRVELRADCPEVVTFVDRDGTWYWTPSPQTRAMLESVLAPLPPCLGCGLGGTGRVSGRLLAVGGPPGTGARLLPGHVTLNRNGERTLLVLDDGRFGATLPPGRYRVVGYSPSYQDGKAACQPLHPFVTVRAGQTTQVNVLCQEK